MYLVLIAPVGRWDFRRMGESCGTRLASALLRKSAPVRDTRNSEQLFAKARGRKSNCMRIVFLDYDARPRPKTIGEPNYVVHPEDMQDGVGEDFLVGMGCARILGMEFTREEAVSDARDKT